MSIEIMTAVWKQSPHEGSTLLILLALADMANDDGVCWPSLRTLAHRGRINERYTRKVLRKLETDGDISVKIQAGKDTPFGKVNLYQVNYPRTGGSLATGGVLQDPRGGSHKTVGGVTQNPLNHQEPSIEPLSLTGCTPDVVLPVAKPALDSQNQSEESEGGEHSETISPPEVETFEGSCANDTKPVEVDVWREKRGASRSPVAQKENEKPLAMLAAYRSVRYPGKPNYTRSEWNAFKTNLRALVDDGRTTEEMATATATALATWTTPEMVNPRSVAAHFDTLLETAAKRANGQTAAPNGTPPSLGQESALNGQSQGRAERTHIDETLPCDCGKENGRHRVYCSCMVLGPYRGHLTAQHIGESAQASGKSFLFEAAMAGFPEAEALQMKAEWEKANDDK